MAAKITPFIDLLLVFDEKDYITKWTNEVKKELTFLNKPITTGCCKMLNYDDTNGSLKCKKVVFFTDKDTQSLQLRVKDWLKKLGKLNETNDYLIVNRQADAESNEPVEDVAMTRVVNVPDLAMVALWWPEFLQQSFGTKYPKKKLIWSKNLSPNDPDSSKMFENFRFPAKESLGQTDDIGKADCIILIAENGEPKIDESFKEMVRKAKISKIPVHFIIHKGEATSFDMKWIINATHTPNRPLRAIFWILDDLKFVNVAFTDRPEPKFAPKPSYPLTCTTKGGDWIALEWHMKEPDDVEEEDKVKYFTVEVLSGTGWLFFRREVYDGSGTIAVKYEGLRTDGGYRFRISSENVNGRSRGIGTNQFVSPSSRSWTRIYADCDDCCCKCVLL